MPGTPSIKWNDANQAKLLRALLYYTNYQLSTEMAAKIAAEFGDGVPARAINSYVTLYKKKFADSEAIGKRNSESPSKKRTASMEPPEPQQKKVKRASRIKKEDGLVSADEKPLAGGIKTEAREMTPSSSLSQKLRSGVLEEQQSSDEESIGE